MGHAIFEQRSGILGVGVVTPCGVITADQLIRLGELAKKITVHGMKMTTRQTLVFLINAADLKQFTSEIEKTGLQIGVFGNIVRNVKGCAGNDKLCPRSFGDAFGLGVALQEQYMNQPVPKDFKISTAGCARGCTDPLCADFGVIAVAADRFEIYLGGRGGSKVPRHGEKIIDNISSEQVIKVLDYVLEKYRALGAPNERLCKVVDRCGINGFVPPAAVYGGKDAADQPSELDDFQAFLAGKQ
ncbi:MAG: nitrite/sulfite reductase ferredoxin-like protein [Firmicutes bacterium]|nr:nitrite/sulfite reductase ferredoxin-like protein [Bacillota bacterium]